MNHAIEIPLVEIFTYETVMQRVAEEVQKRHQLRTWTEDDINRLASDVFDKIVEKSPHGRRVMDFVPRYLDFEIASGGDVSHYHYRPSS